MNKNYHGILTSIDLGRCPSCQKDLILPRGLELDELHKCPRCGAASKGYKWLADKGESAKKRMDRFIKKLEEDIDKAAEDQFQNVIAMEDIQTETKKEV